MVNTSSDVELPPLRSLDDFLLGSARFQLPNYRDLEKWGNRVVQNLLYYQTNYFVMTVILVLAVAVLHPVQMACGCLSVVIMYGLFNYTFSASRFKKEHPTLGLVLMLGGCCLVMYLFSSLLVFLFGVLLPICATFLHASLRLRNLKNKLSNIERVVSNKTPMGVVLESLVESISQRVNQLVHRGSDVLVALLTNESGIQAGSQADDELTVSSVRHSVTSTESVSEVEDPLALPCDDDGDEGSIKEPVEEVIRVRSSTYPDDDDDDDMFGQMVESICSSARRSNLEAAGRSLPSQAFIDQPVTQSFEQSFKQSATYLVNDLVHRSVNKFVDKLGGRVLNRSTHDFVSQNLSQLISQCILERRKA